MSSACLDFVHEYQGCDHYVITGCKLHQFCFIAYVRQRFTKEILFRTAETPPTRNLPNCGTVGGTRVGPSRFRSVASPFQLSRRWCSPKARSHYLIAMLRPGRSDIIRGHRRPPVHRRTPAGPSSPLNSVHFRTGTGLVCNHLLPNETSAPPVRPQLPAGAEEIHTITEARSTSHWFRARGAVSGVRGDDCCTVLGLAAGRFLSLFRRSGRTRADKSERIGTP